MLAQFGIWPLDRPHLSDDMASISQVLDQLGVRYEIGPMGTTIEGEWHEVMDAIHACHEAMRGPHQRIVTNITIDDDTTRPLRIRQATEKVAARRDRDG